MFELEPAFAFMQEMEQRISSQKKLQWVWKVALVDSEPD